MMDKHESEFCNTHSGLLKKIASDYVAKNPGKQLVDPSLRDVPNEEIVVDFIKRHMFYLAEHISKMDMKGMRVLDVACGSPLNIYGPYFEPWIARTLTGLGAKVTGVDLYDAPGEPYEHIKMNLCEEKLSEKLRGRKFDFALCTSLFNSDEIILGAPSCKYMSPTTLFRDVAGQVFPLLENGGLYFANPSVMDAREILEQIGFEIASEDTLIHVMAKKIKN